MAVFWSYFRDFVGAQKIEDFTESKNFFAELFQITSTFVLTKKKLGVRCTLKHHISTQNEGKDFLATSIFQNFVRDWRHAGGHIGGMLPNGLGTLSSAEVANLLRDVGACSPREILKFRRLELLFSAIFQSVFGPKVQSDL